MSDNDTRIETTSEAIAADVIPTAPVAEAPAAEATATMETIVTPAKTDAVGPTVTNRRGFAIGLRLVRAAFVLALLIGGASLGYRVYLANQPVEAVTGDPGIVGVPTPAVVQELVGAIEGNDGDRIRSALQTEMFNRYTAEMERFGIATIESVTTLGTYADGDQTATEIVILAQTTDQIPFAINLVVMTQNGQIVRLR